jgi:hypothetical protein
VTAFQFNITDLSAPAAVKPAGTFEVVTVPPPPPPPPPPDRASGKNTGPLQERESTKEVRIQKTGDRM